MEPCRKCGSDDVEVVRVVPTYGSGTQGSIRDDYWLVCQSCGHEQVRTEYPNR